MRKQKNYLKVIKTECGNCWQVNTHEGVEIQEYHKSIYKKYGKCSVLCTCDKCKGLTNQRIIF